MPDQQNPVNSSDDPVDARLRQLVGDASADAPAAPDPATFVGVNASLVASLDTARHRQRRWLMGGAVGLTAAAAAVTFLVLDTEPSDTLVPATVAITEPTTDPTVVETAPTESSVPVVAPTAPLDSTAPAVVETVPQPSTTAAEASPSTSSPGNDTDPLAATFVGLGASITGSEPFEFDFAVAPLNREDSADPTIVARYRTSEGSNAIVIRSGPQRYTSQDNPIGTTGQSVGGRNVYGTDDFNRDLFDPDSVGPCTSVSCSVWIPWDDNTDVSIQWTARPGTTSIGTDPVPTLERLLQVADRLIDDPDRLPSVRPTVVESAPTISNDGIIVADQTGVFVQDGWEPAPRQLTDTPSFAAVGLPDGRVVVSTGTGRGLPGELFTVVPLEGAELVPFWVDGLPEDGTVSIDVKDAATIDGVSTILYQATTGSCSGGQDGVFECDGTLETATIPVFDGQPLDRAADRRIIRDFGSVWERGIDVAISDRQQLPDISGVLHDLVIATPYFAAADGGPPSIDLSPNYPASYSEATVHIEIDDGYLVDYIDELGFGDNSIPEVRVSDRVGDAETIFSIEAVLPIAGFNQEPAPVNDLVPNVRRGNTFGALGTVWIETYEDAPDGGVDTVFIEVDLNGDEVRRISTGQDANIGSSLTTNNR